MAMLAETRKKQKWTLNPRGSAWSNDSSKFGEKLLRKMGWTAGQGLGLNQQGIKEHVKVKVKHDSKGLGFKDNDQVWVEVENDFSNLLSKLSSQAEKPAGDSSNPTEEPVSDSSVPIEKVNRSLEEKSKKSKARVHYQKFTRGKDLSRYSKRDLECIFGVSTKSTESKHEENQNFVPSGNMEEYFKSKKLNKGSSREMKNTNSANDDQKESDSSETNNGEQGTEESVSQKKKNKKSKKRKLEENGTSEVKEDQVFEETNTEKNNDVDNDDNETNNTAHVSEETMSLKKKNKKSKKKKNKENNGDGVTEPSSTLEANDVETNITEPNNEETSSQKKKNKKSKKRKHDENNDSSNPNSLEVKDEVDKKKRKHSKDVESEVVENVEEKGEQADTVENNSNETKSKKNKTKKKSKVEQSDVLLRQIDGNYDSSEVEEFVTRPSENFETNLTVDIDEDNTSKKKNTSAVHIDSNNRNKENKNTPIGTNNQNQKLNEIKLKVATSSIAEWCKKNSVAEKSRNDSTKTLMKDPTKTVMKHINETNEEVSKQIDDIVQIKISNYLNQVFNKKDRTMNPARELKEKKKKLVEEDKSCVQFSGSNLTCIPGYGCY
uniref:PIN2/TERF1-interacting telomerase inhibitor 1 n=1 Tax=Cacopsylla melanoneura TaxID=428564 RepID=A0A8D9BR14_9HEMI